MRIGTGATSTAQPAERAAGAPPTFYINRDRDQDRRQALEEHLRVAGIAGERIGAVEGLAVPAEFRDMFFKGSVLHSRLKPGEVGCYASHLKTMQVIVDRDLDYALVLEDDAILPADFQTIIAQVLARLPHGWDLVHICRDANRAVKPVAALDHGRRIVRYSRIPETTTAYLVSRTGAKKFLRPIKRYWPVDTDFRQPWRFGLEIYGVDPCIIRPNGRFVSAIHGMGNHSRLRRGLPIPSAHCWTGNPLHTPEGVVFNLKKLGPTAWALCSVHNGMRRIVSMLGLRPVLRRLRLEGLGTRLAGNLASGR
ncbi:MAG: glycosyltransferase family 25 protein [Hyphomicrobium sp.]|nr:glycosyltransferase family 25 protein [Hyphomicrobium sp.]